MTKAIQHLAFDQAVTLLRDHGSTTELRSALEIARSFGAGWRDELTMLSAYIFCGFRGDIRCFSEGHYLLSEPGINRQSQVLQRQGRPTGR